MNKDYEPIEIRQLGEHTEDIRKGLLDPIKWASRPVLFDINCIHREEDIKDISYQDNILKESPPPLGGEGGGDTYILEKKIQQLKGQILFLQAKLNEHLDKAKLNSFLAAFNTKTTLVKKYLKGLQ